MGEDQMSETPSSFSSMYMRGWSCTMISPAGMKVLQPRQHPSHLSAEQIDKGAVPQTSQQDQMDQSSSREHQAVGRCSCNKMSCGSSSPLADTQRCSSNDLCIYHTTSHHQSRTPHSFSTLCWM
jgi:hypothetical protein